MKGTGKFNDKNCSVLSKGGAKEGDYELEEWSLAKKTAYKGSSGRSVLSAFIKGFGVVGDTECQKAKSAGSVTGPKASTTTVTFEKCSLGGKACTSPGAKAGKIVTFPLDGLLVPIGSGSGVGEEVRGTGPGGKLAEYDCEGEEVSTTGAVTGEVTGDVGVPSKTSSVLFTTNAGGEPTITSSEPLLTTIVGVGTFESGESTTETLKGEAFEIS